MRKHSEVNTHTQKKRDNIFLSLFAELPEFNFRGNREVVIEGSKGVLHYSEEVIRINTGMGLVCFEGRNLNLKCISSSKLIITGFILKVEYIV